MILTADGRSSRPVVRRASFDSIEHTALLDRVRHGVMELLLVLPDGSKSLVPARLDGREAIRRGRCGRGGNAGVGERPAAPVRVGHRPVAARTARAGTGCRDVTVQGGLPCSLSSSV